MNKESILIATPRELGTKHTIRKLRREGYIPTVLYGNNYENEYLQLIESDVIKLLNRQGTGALIQVKVDGNTHPVMIKEIQKHPSTGQFVHIDLLRVAMNKKIKSTIPVNFKGEPQEGGILQTLIRNIEVEGFPDELPDVIEVDISNLKENDKVFVSDLQDITAVKIITELEQVVATIGSPRANVEVSPEEAVTHEDEFNKVLEGATV